jgi:hypothetical protein
MHATYPSGSGQGRHAPDPTPTPTGSSRAYGRERQHVSYGDAALRAEVADLDPLIHDRRKTLYLAARRLGQLVAGGELERHVAAAALQSAGVAVLRLPASDVAKEVRKGLDAGARNPRTAPDWHTVRDAATAALVWLDWYTNLDQSAMPGTRGSTELTLYAGIALVGIAVGKVDLTLSIRDVHRWTGLAVSTILRLKDDVVLATGVLRVRQGDGRPALDGRATTVWSPNGKRAFSRQSGAQPSGQCPSVAKKRVCLDPSLNVFANRRNARRLAELLGTDSEVTVAELVENTKLAPVTVLRNLKYLAAAGLAQRLDRTHWKATPTQPTADQEAPDGVDHRQQRQDRNERERAQFRAHRAARAAVWREGELQRKERDEWAAMTSRPGFDPDEPMPVFDELTGEVLELAAA